MIKLKSVEIEEIDQNGQLGFKYEKFNLNHLNLLLGDNAQGKSRLLRVLAFISSLVSNKPRIIKTHFKAILNFISNQNDKIDYLIEIKYLNNLNIYLETIQKNNKEIFSKKNNILFDEEKNKNIDNFFIPENLPAINSINKPEFKTIILIKNFLQKIILFESAVQSRDITITPNADIPFKSDEFLNIYPIINISSVLQTWSKKYKEKYNEVIYEFKKCFNFIEDVKFRITPLDNNIQTELLAIKEQNIEKDILQINWSDGIYRTLGLFMLPIVPFKINNKIESPSLILIDEIENGLDFKTLKYVINYFKDYSDSTQIILSSHSPLVCDFIEPENWKIVKRKGAVIKIFSPEENDNDLKNTLSFFKHEHWDFYTKHISTSDEYSIK